MVAFWRRWFVAAYSNPSLASIITLLKAGADLQACDQDGLTALMYSAADSKNPEVITTAGADAKAQDVTGNTAFIYAMNNKNVKGSDAYWKLNEAQ